jgi:hypothetical protein
MILDLKWLEQSLKFSHLELIAEIEIETSMGLKIREVSTFKTGY